MRGDVTYVDIPLIVETLNCQSNTTLVDLTNSKEKCSYRGWSSLNESQRLGYSRFNSPIGSCAQFLREAAVDQESGAVAAAFAEVISAHFLHSSDDWE